MVRFDASASTDPDGTIAEYRWDPEGDGSFSFSTGTSPYLDKEYALAGSYHAAVQVVDNDGVYSQLAVPVSAAAEKYFSLGSPDKSEVANAVVVCNNGQLMLFGSRNQHNVIDEALIMKLAPDGSADLITAWDGSAYETLSDAALGSDGYIYACGSTSSRCPRPGHRIRRQGPRCGAGPCAA